MSKAKYRRLPSCLTQPLRARSFGLVVGVNCGTQLVTPVISAALRYSPDEITPSTFGGVPVYAVSTAAASNSMLPILLVPASRRLSGGWNAEAEGLALGSRLGCHLGIRILLNDCHELLRRLGTLP